LPSLASSLRSWEASSPPAAVLRGRPNRCRRCDEPSDAGAGSRCRHLLRRSGSDRDRSCRSNPLCCDLPRRSPRPTRRCLTAFSRRCRHRDRSARTLHSPACGAHSRRGYGGYNEGCPPRAVSGVALRPASRSPTRSGPKKQRREQVRVPSTYRHAWCRPPLRVESCSQAVDLPQIGSAKRYRICPVHTTDAQQKGSASPVCTLVRSATAEYRACGEIGDEAGGGR
jgi:hypothetical protein